MKKKQDLKEAFDHQQDMKAGLNLLEDLRP